MNYIGSKKSLIGFIFNTIETKVPNEELEKSTVMDLFSGTGAVAKEFKQRGYSVSANDTQHYSYVLLKHFLENNEQQKFTMLGGCPFEILNELDGVEGFIYNNYSLGGTAGTEYERLYFSDTNARKIDAARMQLEQWKNNQMITEGEYFYLLASILESADKVANTTSVYEAFLKKLKPIAKKEITISPVETIIHLPKKNYTVFNKDANSLVKEKTGTILYLDPPYNSRKYDTNYHILETISLYDNPKIKGKTGIRDESVKKSKYSSRIKAQGALSDLIQNAKYEYIFLSYNDEGIIPIENIEKIMKNNGDYTVNSIEYKRYKSDNNRFNKKNTVTEYLHCLRKETK